MTNWKSPDVQERTMAAFIKFLHGLTGLYIWELIVTSDIELKVLTGKRPFRWPLAFYVAGRYCTLASLILGILMFDVGSPSLNCHVTYILINVLTHMSLGLASINLAIRTIAIWMHNKYITRGLCLLIVGQWCLIVIQPTTVVVDTLPGGGCSPESKNQQWIIAVYTYGLFIDSIVITLTIWKLRKSIGTRISTYAYILFQQGIVYYVIAFLFDFVAIVIMLLDLDIGLGAIFTVLAQLAVTIVGGRAVRSLSLKIDPSTQASGLNCPEPFSLHLSTHDPQAVESKPTN